MNNRLKEITPVSTIGGEDDTSRDLGGLLGLTEQGERAFPLREVKVRAAITAGFCRTVVEQRFANPYEVAMEAVHIFPLPEDGAVTELELRAGEVVVRAECREREEAEEIFDQARKRGKRAGLLTQERPDVHTLRVTNVPANTDVTVRMVIIERLAEADGRLGWRFPTVIAPRYTPGEATGHDGDGVVPDTDRAPDASRLQPPLRLAGGTSLDLEVAIRGPLASLESSLHAIRAELGDEVRIAPAVRATLNKDFILRFACGQRRRTCTRAYTDGQYTLAVVAPPVDATSPSLPRDAVFVIDISGSMEGTKLDAARRALATALRGLNTGDRMRLIAFDTEIEEFSRDFVEYTQDNLLQADKWIQRLRARGGTEMLPALTAALKGNTAKGRVRTVLFITDGQVTNDVELFCAVAKHRGQARIFPIGIDTAVHGAMLKRLARIGGGACELLTPGDNIEEAIVRMESRFGLPLVSELLAEGLDAARPEPTVLFADRPAALLFEGAPKRIRMSGKTRRGIKNFVATPVQIDFPLGVLWARERIDWLEDRLMLDPGQEETLRADIVRVALDHGIASRFTAFVAVEDGRSVDGERVTVVQPVELPEAWSESFLGKTSVDYLRARLRDDAWDSAVESIAYQKIAQRDDCVDAHAYITIRCFHKLRIHSDWLSQSGSADVFDDIAEAQPPAPAPKSAASELVRSQASNGSFGEDVGRTAAAVIALLLLGNTSHSGLYRRLVAKALRWLRRHAKDSRAAKVLRLVEHVETAGGQIGRTESEEFLDCLPEGEILRRVLDDLTESQRAQRNP